ncbi:MAG TPA: helix-turn-helix domain-containing protein [Candidatus Limnocylindrales bacterium]|nr:helix-turn-helix domain-containing protein [Candidatus Limnocylindrales bacterium]
MLDELLTVPEVLQRLNTVSKRTFYRWRELGIAPRCFKLPNGELRISERDLKAWLERQREVAA